MRYRLLYCCGPDLLERNFESNRSLAALSRDIVVEGYFEAPAGSTDSFGQPAAATTIFTRHIVSLEEQRQPVI